MICWMKVSMPDVPGPVPLNAGPAVQGAMLTGGRRGGRFYAGSSVMRPALPPAAAVLTVIVCSKTSASMG